MGQCAPSRQPPVDPMPRKTSSQPRPAEPKAVLHPRNRHSGRYDFPADRRLPGAGRVRHPQSLRQAEHRLRQSGCGKGVQPRTAAAVLRHPALGHSCRLPLPAGAGRADYLHGLADLLAADNAGVIPRGTAVRVLDIGTGANCIYPLIGHREYGWRFTGSDIDATALASARTIVAANRLTRPSSCAGRTPRRSSSRASWRRTSASS